MSTPASFNRLKNSNSIRYLLYGVTTLFLLALVTVVIAVLFSGSQPKYRLVMLYIPCTVNNNFLYPYNKAVDYTPNLARFSQNSVVFHKNMSEAGQSGVAYASIFSGTQAPDHGVYKNPMSIASSVHMVSEAFADSGYETFFWAGQGMADEVFNFDQGVEKENVFQHRLKANHPRYLSVLEKLKNDPEYKAFIVTNFTVTHSPYKNRELERFCAEYPHHAAIKNTKHRPFDEYVRLYHENHWYLSKDFPAAIERLNFSQSEVEEFAQVLELLYKSNIHFLDSIFGNALRRLAANGLLDESLIVFTADHGETLYRHDTLFKWTHGWELVPEVLTTPLIIRCPGLPDGIKQYSEVSRSIDVFPTLAGLAGISTPEIKDPKGPQGVDLSPVLTGSTSPPHLKAYSHTIVQHERAWETIRQMSLWMKYHKGVNVSDMWVSVRDRDLLYKYRNTDGENWGFQLFDLSRNAYGELVQFDPANPQHRQTAEQLLEYQDLLMNGWNGSNSDDVDALKALKELGYIR